MPDFRAYSAKGQIDGANFYYIESTAPENVGQCVAKTVDRPAWLTNLDPDTAVRQIVDALIPPGEPDVDSNLVVMVHGFNNPRPNALEFYAGAAEALEADAAKIFRDPSRKVVCIGYRWPSETMFGAPGNISALPILPLLLCAFSLLVLALRLLLAFAKHHGWDVGPHWAYDIVWWFAYPAFAFVTVFGVVVLLRSIVYFRDIYRATNYGVPDIVELIRQIDREACEKVDKLWRQGERPRKRIALSFVGHSMGGLIVTNAIRVLSDVFDKDTIRTTLAGKPLPAADASDGADLVPGRIGHVFTLMRFVLASPDIPAETLLSDRANFLASALRRFREAYLFSSEGDEVLLLVSTIANYFYFPTKNRNFGYRLGNLEILSKGFGHIQNHRLLKELRPGSKTLAELSSKTAPGNKDNPGDVASAFTYFDCTDYVDGPGSKGLLTRARNYKARNSHRHIPFREDLRLLGRYLLPARLKNYINVHGGYFDGDVTRRLIYRLACLGYDATLKAYEDDGIKMSQACSEHQIRFMVSKRLKHKLPLETMATPAMVASVRQSFPLNQAPCDAPAPHAA